MIILHRRPGGGRGRNGLKRALASCGPGLRRGDGIRLGRF